MSIKDGGPAFPVTVSNYGETEVAGFDGNKIGAKEMVVYAGITMRDYLAAKALQSIVLQEYEKWSPEAKADKWARESYEIADAMLKAREQQP